MSGYDADLEGAERFLKAYTAQVGRLAQELRRQPMPVLSEELYREFERTGNRLRYEEAYFGRRRFLAVYGMAAVLSGEEQELRMLEKVMREVCRERCWALPAHVDRGRPDWERTVDLFAAETAQTLAELTELLRGKLSPDVVRLVRAEAKRRVLRPFFSSAVPYSWWEGCTNNWNAVCAGAIGSAYLYLYGSGAGKEERRETEGEPMDDRQACLARLCASLARYPDGFSEDGACLEGLDYFTYGMTYYVGFARQLRESGGKDLLASAKLAAIARFPQKLLFSFGGTVSFSDGSSQSRLHAGLMTFLETEYKGVKPFDFAFARSFTTDSCFRFMALYRDYAWVKDYVRDKKRRANAREAAGAVSWNEEVPSGAQKKLGVGSKGEASSEGLPESGGGRRADVLSDAQWAVAESDNGVGMAAKGGDNDEPHNHNDVGSFLYFVGEEMLLADLGAGEYTKEYFSGGRYEIFCNSSFGHNLPIVDGKGQQSGKRHACREFRACLAERRTLHLRMELAPAYPDGLLLRAERELSFDLETGKLQIRDELLPCAADSTVTERFVTEGRIVKKSETEFVIFGARRSCRLTLAETPERAVIREQKHRRHDGTAETVCCLDVVPAARNEAGFAAEVTIEPEA